MFGKTSNNVARRNLKKPVYRQPPQIKKVLKLPNLKRKPIFPILAHRPHKTHQSHRPVRQHPHPQQQKHHRPVHKTPPTPTKSTGYTLDAHSTAPPALPPSYNYQSGDYEIEPEASTSGIGFDYEVITTQPPVQVVENEIIYSYSTPQPSVSFYNTNDGSSSDLALGTANNFNSNNNNNNNFSPPQAHEIIKISTNNNGLGASVDVSNSFSFSANNPPPPPPLPQAQPLQQPLPQAQPLQQPIQQLNSFSSDEELVNNGFNNLPSLRQIKNTMDTSINSIENDIDDGFAAIDADIKKITFSTMELSHMNNQTLKELFPSPQFSPSPAASPSPSPAPTAPPASFQPIIRREIFPGHKLAQPVQPTQQPRLTVTVKDFVPNQKPESKSENHIFSQNSLLSKGPEKPHILTLKTILSGEADSETISEFLYDSFISNGYEDLLDDKIDEIKAEAMKLEEEYWGKKSRDFSLDI